VQTLGIDAQETRLMSLRSLLFVPGDSERKLAKSSAVAADVLIFDLEDSVVAERKAFAREQVLNHLQNQARDTTEFWVRINDLQSGQALEDLTAVIGGRPDGIVQPKTRHPDDTVRLSHYLDAFEAQYGYQAGSIRILPVATETPEAIFSIGGFGSCGGRLAALTWGAEDLSAAVGATTNKQDDGGWSPPYQLARSLCLFGASAAGVPAIDTLFGDFRDSDGLREACTAARRDGFTGKLAVHPDQVAIINECFTPSQAELERAQRIVELFDQNSNTGTLALDGEMLDMPHLRQAQRVIAAWKTRDES
jgi:citrate lyase subunit beta/citryl-CoA lyase